MERNASRAFQVHEWRYGGHPDIHWMVVGSHQKADDVDEDCIDNRPICLVGFSLLRIGAKLRNCELKLRFEFP